MALLAALSRKYDVHRTTEHRWHGSVYSADAWRYANQYILGRVGDKTGNKVMMIRALMGLALTQLGLAFANEVWLVLILRFCRVPVRVILRRLRPMVLQWCQRHSVRDFCLVTGVNQRRLFGRGDYRGAILDLLSFFWINVSAFIICTLCALIVLFILPADAPHEVSSTSAVHSKDKKRTQLESTMASLLAY